MNIFDHKTCFFIYFMSLALISEQYFCMKPAYGCTLIV